MKSNKTAVFLQLYIKYGKQRSSKVKQAQKEAKYMNITFSKAFLMSGEDFKLTSSITLHHPTIKEILSISQSSSPDLIYWSYIQILLADPYLNMVMLDDMGKNYLETSPYEVFHLQWDNCIANYEENKAEYDAYQIHPGDQITDALQFFMVETHYFKKGFYQDGSPCFYDEADPSCQINQEIFEYIYQWVKAVNKIDHSGRIHPADENARRVLIEDMREEIKKAKRRKKKKEEDFDLLGSLMAAGCFCGNGSISPFQIGDCKIYWLNEALSLNNRKDYADHLLDGIYHGTLRFKDINKKELDWLK